MKTIQPASQTEKNLTNITTNPETPNRNKGQIIANEHKIHIIDALTVNQSPMTDNMKAPKSGVQRTISPLKKATQFIAASIASLTLAHADTAPVAASTTNATQTTQKVVKVDAPADYKIKVDKMTEKELRAESKALRAEIQPLVDSGAKESVLRPLLLKYKIVSDRLSPIVKANTEKNNQVIAESNQVIAESKKASAELDHASSLFDDIKKQLLNPETIDEEKLIKQLKEARRIHKKYNPELYSMNK